MSLTLFYISIRKGQYSISVIVILFEAQVISHDLTCSNQAADGDSKSQVLHFTELLLPCASVQVTKAEKPDSRSIQDLSLREYGEAGERHPG